MQGCRKGVWVWWGTCSPVLANHAQFRRKGRRPLISSNKIQYSFILQHASLSHTTCTLTETTTGTLTRPGGGFGIVPDRISGSIPFENGHVTHLDLAAVHPRIVGSNHHLHGHGGQSDHTIGGGGFMTSSLSAAALNASSWYLSCCIKFVNSTMADFF